MPLAHSLRMGVANFARGNQNNDVRPVETARRTWTFGSFHNFCMSLHTNACTVDSLLIC